MCRESPFSVFVVFLLSLVLISAAYAAEPNLVGWWRFDEGSGITAYDSAGGNHGTIHGAEWTLGRVGDALKFDGLDDYVEVNGVYANGSTGMTWSVWFKFEENDKFILDQRENGTGYQPIYLGGLGSDLQFYSSDTGDSNYFNTNLQKYNWYHAAMVLNDSNVFCYVDGLLFDYKSDTSYDFGTKDLFIGARHTISNCFKGVIDNVCIYDRALSDEEIWELYQDQFGSRAYDPDPYSGESGLAFDVVLRWHEGKDAVSHDVYLGTNFDGVNNAGRLYGDIDGDGQVDWYDVLVLNEQWLDEPEEPYADLDGDGDVNFVDFTVVADDWMGRADAVFKGNQDSNSYDPCGLALSTTHYWRVDEVNGPNTWRGEVWNFRTTSPKKGPYLLYPDDNNDMTILWQLVKDVNCTLQWGPNTSYSEGSTIVNEYGVDHQYKYAITGLTPATKYYYKVTLDTGYFVGSFRSAPSGTATAVKFLAYGDTRTYPATHDTVNQAMINTFKTDPNYQTFTILTGDWVAVGEDEDDWTNQFFDPKYVNIRYMQANLPINGCIGNHEWDSGSSPPTFFDKYWPYPYVLGFYWSFDYGPVHIAVVDQYDEDYDSGSDQLTWLENDLSTTTKEWKFIMLHEPGYSAGGGHDDNGDVQTYIQPLCETYDVDIVFAGHNHYYARCDKNGVKHITTGGGGAPLADCNPNYSDYVETCTKAYHFCKIDIDGNELDFVAVEPDGTVIDSFTLTH